MNQVEEDKKVEYIEGSTVKIGEIGYQEILDHYIPYIQQLLPQEIRSKIEAGTHKIVAKYNSLGSSVLDIHPHNRAERIEYTLVSVDRGIYSSSICSFVYYSMTNCCGALNFSNTNVSYTERGIGSLLQYLKEDISYINGVGYIQCCDKFIEKNDHVLTKYGNYPVVDSFKNPKSLNEVRVYGKHLDRWNDTRKFKIKIRN